MFGFFALVFLEAGFIGGEKSKEESLKVIYVVYLVAHSSPTQVFTITSSASDFFVLVIPPLYLFNLVYLTKH